MDHDFHGQDSTKLKNSPDGKGKCSGIMDYTDSTTGWSKCSNADIQKFLNGLSKNCLIRKYFHEINHFLIKLIAKYLIETLNVNFQNYHFNLLAIGTAGRSTEWSEGKVEGSIPDPNGECKPPLCVVFPQEEFTSKQE